MCGLALLALYGSSGAAALSAMPNGEGNPYPSLLAFLVIVGILAVVYAAVDQVERRIIERMKRDKDVEGLVSALKNSWLSRKAACALGDMRAGRAVEPLLAALHDDNSDVRQAAAKALGDIGDGRAMEPLREALRDEYRGVRECASFALKRLQKPDNAL